MSAETSCTCVPGEGCDEEGDPGCAYCRSLDCEWPCPAEGDLGLCPYFARYHGLEGHDPEAICGDGHCGRMPMPEPERITCEPSLGWPSLWANGTYVEPEPPITPIPQS